MAEISLARLLPQLLLGERGRRMSDTLFEIQTFASHCIYCKHIERASDGVTSSDAMERHYWDNHYTPESRAALRKAGQRPERIGVKP